MSFSCPHQQPMSAPYIVSIAGSPARVAYQPSSDTAFITSPFLSTIRSSSTISTRNTVTLYVSVPTTTGIFTSDSEFTISDAGALVDGLPMAAVLGRHWLGTCLALANDGLVSFLPSTAEYLYQMSHTVPPRVMEMTFSLFSLCS